MAVVRAMVRQVRGSVLNAYLGFINLKWGRAALKQCLDDLKITAEFKSGEYYDEGYRISLLKWISQEKGMDYNAELGRHVVKNLGLLAWIVRFANPKILAKKFPENYKEVYNFGRIEVDIKEGNTIHLRLYDVNSIKESCLSWHGVCEGALEITKKSGVVTKTMCQLEGHDCCEYKIDYD